MDPPPGTEPLALRRLSHIENYSSTRHHLGIYRCVVVTCRYRLLSSPRLSPPTLDAFAAAVACVVAAQPMLRVGILDQHTSHAARFSHVPRVDLRRHLSWDRLPAGPGYEARLAERQAWHHDQLWTDIETRPPWRVQVLRPGSDSCSGSGPDSAPFYDVLFAFHHALMDGSAGKAFHQHLLAALNLSPSSPSSSSPSSSSPSSSPPSSSSDPYLLSFPDPPTLPEAQEDVIPFTNSIPFLVSTVLRDLGPAILRPWLAAPVPWHGKPVDLSLAYRTRALPVDVAAPVAAALLVGCRARAASLTALLHALVLSSLALRIRQESPSSFDTPFAASTPISLRPYLSAAADPALRPLLRNLVTGYTCHFSALQAAALCAAAAPTLAQNSDDDAALDALIWETARRVRRDLAARLATLPADDSSGLAGYVGDWLRFHRAKDGRPRAESWEVSNLGVLSTDGDDGGDGPWSVSRVFFTNGAMVAGPPLGVNVASAPGGTLTIALSWQDTVIPTELAERLAEDLGTLTQRFYDTGAFSMT